AQTARSEQARAQGRLRRCYRESDRPGLHSRKAPGGEVSVEIIYSGHIPETIRTDENGKFKIPLEAYALLHEYTIMASPQAAFVPDIDQYTCGLSLKKPTSGEKISSYPYEVEINPCGRYLNVQYYCLDFATVGGCNLGYTEK